MTESRAEIQDFQELPSPFLVLSTTRLTMTGIRQMGVITRAKTMIGGGSLSSSVGQSLKKLEWMSTKVCSTRGLGHGITRQSDISSVQRLRLLYELQCGDRECVEDYSDIGKYLTISLMLKIMNCKYKRTAPTCSHYPKCTSQCCLMMPLLSQIWGDIDGQTGRKGSPLLVHHKHCSRCCKFAHNCENYSHKLHELKS